MILDDIIEKRKIQLERERSNISPEEMKRLALVSDMPVISFYDALKKDRLSVICEVKKASPSKGLIRENFDPAQIAEEYAKAGAEAISCLTEEHYFQGSSQYLKDVKKSANAVADIPILRKDFIFDEYQIYEAKVIGANAVLLIAAVLSQEKMDYFYKLADSLGMDCLVEVHNKEELDAAMTLSPKILGINNRNLKTFEVDLNTTSKLRKYIPEESVLVSESGIRNNDDMRLVRSLGADAVLIGETLMRSADIAAELAALREGV